MYSLPLLALIWFCEPISHDAGSFQFRQITSESPPILVALFGWAGFPLNHLGVPDGTTCQLVPITGGFLMTRTNLREFDLNRGKPQRHFGSWTVVTQTTAKGTSNPRHISHAMAVSSEEFENGVAKPNLAPTPFVVLTFHAC